MRPTVQCELSEYRLALESKWYSHLQIGLEVFGRRVAITLAISLRWGAYLSIYIVCEVINKPDKFKISPAARNVQKNKVRQIIIVLN